MEQRCNLQIDVPTATRLSPLRRSTPLHRNNSIESFAIEGRNLSFSFKSHQGQSFPIIRDCSLRVPSGQLWMLLGPNGSGKSTLLKILAGLLLPTSGALCIQSPTSFVFQNPDHQVVMPTVEGDVSFGLGKFNLTENEVRKRVSKALDSVGMSTYTQRPVQTLSGGQKQRVAIAGALAEACKIGVIKAVKNSVSGCGEMSALWVTHRLEELEYADGAFYMENGRVVKCGSRSSIMEFINATQSSYINHINS